MPVCLLKVHHSGYTHTGILLSPSLKIIHYVKIIIKHCIRAQSFGNNKKVEEFVAQQKNNTYNYKQVSHAIGAGTTAQQRNVALQLVEMAFNGEIIEVSPGKYKSPQRGNEAIGTFVRRSNGKTRLSPTPTAKHYL